MQRTWMIFKAIFWKEYRESRSVLLSLALLIVAAAIYVEWYYPYYITSIMTSRRVRLPALPLYLFYHYYTAAISAIALCFFLPLLSRETERETLSIQALKPITPDLAGILQWISAFLLSLIPFLVFFFALCVRFSDMAKQVALNPGRNAMLLFLLSDRLFWFSFGIGILITAGVFFYLFSMFGANRIQSLAIALIGIACLYTGYFLLDNTFFSLRVTYWFKMKIASQMNPFTVFGLAFLALITCSLFLQRRRLFNRVVYRRRYGAVIAACCGCFTILVWSAVTNKNLTQMEMDRNAIPAPIIEMILSEQQIAREKQVLSVVQDFNPQNNETEQSTSESPNQEYRVLSDSPQSSFSLDFKVHSYDQLPGGKVIFKHPIIDRVLLKKYGPSSTLSYLTVPGRIVAARKRGVIIKSMKSGVRSNELPTFILNQFELGEEIKLTPVKTIEMKLHFSGESFSSSVQMDQSGVCTSADLSQLVEAFVKKSTFHHSNPEMQTIIMDLIEKYCTTWSGVHDAWVDNHTSERHYWFFTIQFPQSSPMPILASFDFSDLDTLNVNLWEFDAIPQSSLTYSSIARINGTEIKAFNQFCVDTNSLVLNYNAPNGEELMALDLSDNAALKPTVTFQNPFNDQRRQRLYWPAQQQMIFDEKKLILWNKELLCIYTIERGGSLSLFARLINQDPQIMIRNVKAEGEILYVQWTALDVGYNFYTSHRMGTDGIEDGADIAPLWDYEVFPQMRDSNSRNLFLSGIETPSPQRGER
ncbi:MAG: ABC transporter permease [Candidatus Omnitrophota bacterium]|nr:MAG: ABC transporter permease [Candidatus Omnitrophota bacterium]